MTGDARFRAVLDEQDREAAAQGLRVVAGQLRERGPEDCRQGLARDADAEAGGLERTADVLDAMRGPLDCCWEGCLAAVGGRGEHPAWAVSPEDWAAAGVALDILSGTLQRAGDRGAAARMAALGETARAIGGWTDRLSKRLATLD